MSGGLPVPSVRQGGQATLARQRADDLAQVVYRLSWKFAQSDAVLAQWMRNAAIAIATTVASSHPAETPRARRALATASTALTELACCARLARRLGLLTETDLMRMQALHAEVRAAIDPP